MATAGIDPDEPREYSQAAKDWMRKRAATERRKDVTVESRLGYEAITFPDTAGCRRAALVVCAQAKDAADAKLLLEALALPTILAHGGDGRVLKVQKGPVRLGEREVEAKPLGYSDDDWGKPPAKPKRTERKPRS